MTLILPSRVRRRATALGYASNTYLTTVTYYDIYGRPIQTRSTNSKAGYDHYTNKYTNLTSRIALTDHYHKAIAGTTTIIKTEQTRNIYDATGRPVTMYYSYNGTTPMQVSKMAYNEDGTMKYKTQGSSVTDIYQQIDYTYNIKGWLTQINSPSQVSDAGDLFGMRLFYNVANSQIGNTSMYNGNISGVIWQNTPALSAASNPLGGPKAYTYAYDGLNRLTAGSFKEYISQIAWDENTQYDSPGGGGTTPSPWSFNNKYSESLTYDRNGNILSLVRKGLRTPNNLTGIIDSLAYTYNPYNTSNYGNKLLAVDDALNDNANGGFADNGSLYSVTHRAEYSYDADGNMTSDANKKIQSITYNYMNLPITVTSTYGESVTYLYDAAGNKLKQTYINNGGAGPKTTEFVSNFVYENNLLAWVSTPEGRIAINTDGTMRQEFNIKDHLGNVRVVYSRVSNANVTQQVDTYYPFGMNIKGLTATKTGSTRPNEYLYNGKMSQDEMGLALLDYGKRFYDPVIGRFTGVDPISDKFNWVNPFNYAENRPITGIDLWGLQYISIHHLPNGGIQSIEYYKMTNSEIQKYGGTTAGIHNSVPYGPEGKGVVHYFYDSKGNRIDNQTTWEQRQTGGKSDFMFHGLYSGPGSITYDGKENYDFSRQPIDWADAIAKRHDMDYMNAVPNYAGFLEDVRTLQADKDMVSRIDELIKNNWYKIPGMELEGPQGVETPVRTTTSTEFEGTLYGQRELINALATYKQWKIDNKLGNSDKYLNNREAFIKEHPIAGGIIDLLQ